MISDSTTTASNVAAENVHVILTRILSHLHQTQDDIEGTTSNRTTREAARFVAELERIICPPSFLLSILVPRLFSPASSGPTTNRADNSGGEDDAAASNTPSSTTSTAPISSADALSIITFLVTHSPAIFVVPTSRSVRAEAERLCSSSSQRRGRSSTDGNDTSNNDTVQISDSALGAVVGQLQSGSGEVATNTTRTLLALCGAATGGDGAPFSERIVRALTSSWNRFGASSCGSSGANRHRLSTVTVRYASLLVSVLTSPSHSSGTGGGEEAVQAALRHSSLDLLLLDFLPPSRHEDDPLLQMSVLDQIERFATTGLPTMGALRKEWLTSPRVVRPLLELAGGIAAGRDGGADGGADVGPETKAGEKEGEAAPAEPHPILGGSALRILSSICKILPGSSPSGGAPIAGFRRALRTFAESASGEVDRIALVDAISSFASVSEEALTSVLEERVGCEEVALCERWLNIGGMPQSKLKALVLCSIARVMDPLSGEADGDGSDGDGSDGTVATNRQRCYVPSSKLSLMLMRCFGRVNNNGNSSPELLLLNLSRSPFVEVRLGAYELMRAFVSKVRTGATVLLSQAGFLEFLLSCEGERVKEGKEARFAIVQAVLKSATRELLADNVVEDLERVVREGPYYVKSVNWQFATEQ